MPKEKEEYLTPGEILHEYPFLKDDHNWSIQTPGVLLSIGVLHGKYLKGKHMTLIARSSLERLFCYYRKFMAERQSHLGEDKPN